jgi:hypothetical protein
MVLIGGRFATGPSMPLSAVAVRRTARAAATAAIVVAAAVGTPLDATAPLLPIAKPPSAEMSAETPAAPPAPDAAPLTTEAYLEMPEIFRISVVSGSIAMLLRLKHGADIEKHCECYARWTASEDVVALVSLHVQRNPAALEAPFADTLLAALAERCRGE